MNTLEDEFELTGSLETSDAFEDVSSSTGDGEEDLGSSAHEETEFNREENISWSDSAFDEKSSFCDASASDTKDGFRYRPSRVSYMYASHYTLNAENLQRAPLATFGKWGSKPSSTTAEKARKMVEMFCWKKKCCLPLLFLLLFVIVSCCVKDHDRVKKLYSDVTHTSVVVMVKSQWDRMVASLYAGSSSDVDKATTKETTKADSSGNDDKTPKAGT